MLQVEGLRAGYGTSQALAGVELEVPDGKLVAILGRNGMGKTSLCRSVMSLAPPQVWGGSVTYDETELTRLEAHAVARAGVGYVPQGRRVFASLDVVDNLTVAARTNEAGQLSGGEQQMLAIARALMTNPSLLIMDEPSEGLAPKIVESVGEQLRDLKGGGLSMLLVEQNYSLAIGLADLVYVLENGEVVFRGEPQQLDGDEEVKRRYLGVGV